MGFDKIIGRRRAVDGPRAMTNRYFGPGGLNVHVSEVTSFRVGSR